MTKFFIHIQNGAGFQLDEHGREYPNEDAAIHDAARAASEIMRDELIEGRPGTAIEVIVERDGGARVGTIGVAAQLTRVS